MNEANTNPNERVHESELRLARARQLGTLVHRAARISAEKWLVRAVRNLHQPWLQWPRPFA